MSSQLPAEATDAAEDDDDGSLQFFVSSLAANTPLLASAACGAGVLATPALAVDGCAGMASSSFDADMDFTALVSPTKVN